jgi:hypothetical protein
MVILLHASPRSRSHRNRRTALFPRIRTMISDDLDQHTLRHLACRDIEIVE